MWSYNSVTLPEAEVEVTITQIRYSHKGQPLDVRIYEKAAIEMATTGNNKTYSYLLEDNTELEPGYYQFYYYYHAIGSSDAVMNLSVVLGSKHIEAEVPWPTESLVPIYPPRIQTLEDPYTAARVTSCAILASNATNMLNIEGSVLAARLDEHAYLPSVLTETTKTRARETIAAKRYFGLLKDGSYMFAPLETQLLQFRDYVVIGRLPYIKQLTEGKVILKEWAVDVPIGGQNPSSDPVNVPVLYTGIGVPFSVVYMTDNGGTTAPGATTMNLKCELHVEYRTDNPQLTLEVARGEQADLLLAQQILAHLPYFYENPTHWQNVIQRLRLAWAHIRPHAPQLLLGAGRAASGAFPEAAPIISTLAQLGAMRLR
jgi:hypothetical protein